MDEYDFDLDFDDEEFDIGRFDAHRRNEDDEMPTFHYRRYGGWINDEGWAIRHDGAGHYPTKIECRVGETDSRGKCMVYDKKCSEKCMKCNVWLHITGGPGDNCFFRFHEDQNFR